MNHQFSYSLTEYNAYTFKAELNCFPHDALGLAVDLDGELGEVLQHLAHLVAALAAAHVDDNVGVGILGQGL